MYYKPLGIVAFLTVLSISMTGCEKVKSLSTKQPHCNDQEVNELFKQNFQNDLKNQVLVAFRDKILRENVNVDINKVNTILEQISYTLADIRTDDSVKNAQKQFCNGQLYVQIPIDLISQANENKKLDGVENSVESSLLMQGFKFEQGKIKGAMNYTAQLADDKKTIILEIDNSQALISNISDIIINALIYQPRQEAIQQAEMEEQQLAQQAEMEEQQHYEAQEKAKQDYINLQVSEAQANLKKANDSLTTMWKATTDAVRKQLLDNQRSWIKHRTVECKLEASNAEKEIAELTRLNCELNRTRKRVNDLKSIIETAEEQTADTNNG